MFLLILKLYIGAAISFLDFTSTTLFRSMITKSIQIDEVGKVFSIIGMFQVCLFFNKLLLLFVSNFQGCNLGHSVTPARTSGLSSTQGVVRERVVKISYSQSY